MYFEDFEANYNCATPLFHCTAPGQTFGLLRGLWQHRLCGGLKWAISDREFGEVGQGLEHQGTKKNCRDIYTPQLLTDNHHCFLILVVVQTWYIYVYTVTVPSNHVLWSQFKLTSGHLLWSFKYCPQFQNRTLTPDLGGICWSLWIWDLVLSVTSKPPRLAQNLGKQLKLENDVLVENVSVSVMT